MINAICQSIELCANTPWRRCILIGSLTALLFALQATAQVQDADIAPTEFSCFLEPNAVIDLGSAVPGVIAHVAVERNDNVSASQIVVELESDVQRAAVDRARARTNVTATIQVRELNAKFSEQQQQRTRDLIAQNMVSEQEYGRLETETKIARLQLREAKDNRTLSYLETLQAEAALNQRVIRSPISGVVTERFKSKGEFVDDKPLLRIVNIDSLNVEMLAPVDLMGKFQLGMTAQVSLMPEHFGSHEATVTLVDKVADAASGTFRVRLNLDNPQHKIPAGLRCIASFHEASLQPEIMAATPAPDAMKPAQDQQNLQH